MRNLLVGVLAAAAAFLQAPAAQPPPTASLVLTGHVITGSGPDARPVRHARVTLTGGVLKTARLADTDTTGSYRFDHLAAGNYRVSVRKGGFVTVIADATPDATLTMVRGGAIEGVVTATSGDPVMNVVVSALRQEGGASPRVAAQARTDDLGRYRLHSLERGEYLIQAATDRIFVLNMGLMPGQKAPDTTAAFYPAASTAESAKAVLVESGRDVSGIDVTLVPNPPVADPAGRPARPAEEPTGTGRIAGRITDRTSGKPIKGARLLLLPRDGVRLTNWTSTDARGRFEYTNLAARKYTLQVGADGFITLEYGRTRPGEAGVLIEVNDGRDVNIDMSLPRGSAVEGALTDEFGDPAPGVVVQLARRQYVAGRQRLMPASGRIQMQPTDDRGHYRVFGLEPSEYYVTALTGAFAEQSGIGGFLPTFYPGTSDSGAATPVSVSLGADNLGVSFSLVSARTLSVSGTMVGDDGRPEAGRGAILLMTPDHLRRTDFNLARGGTSEDGQFILLNVPQGTYTLQGFGPPPPGTRGPGNPNARPFGWLPVTVGDSDVDGLVLKVTNGTTLRGKITLEEGNSPPPSPQQVRVSPIPVEFDSAPVIGGGPLPSETRDDWTFEVTHLSGRQRIFVDIASPGWTLKNITRGGVEITDQAVDFREKDVSDIEVVLTSKVTRLTGGVTDEHGQVNDYAVVIFSSDPTKWVDRSRFVVMARGVQQGRFDVRSLPPDDYLAVALPSVSGTEWMDPEFLQAIRPQATSFSLQEGESKTLELRLKNRP
jgi:5-hydroxyisourate hydrolase-like protein (transthyretin family)